jgi:hypothetical protein
MADYSSNKDLFKFSKDFMNSTIKNSFLVVLILVTIAAFTACERSVEPFEEDQGIYSIYGALEVGAETNIIRVRNLLEPFRADSSFPFDATVTFQDLQTGETTQLRDSVVNFEVGRTNNFILEQDLELDSQYQITVERSDGEQVTSVATTPALTEVSYFPTQFINCETKIDFRFRNVEQSELVQMEIGATYQGDVHWAEMDLVSEVEYDTQLEVHRVQMSPRNLLVEVFTPVLPDNPYFDPYTLFPTVSCDELDNNTIQIRYKHFGPEWQTGRPITRGGIDTDSGDVENGLGFLGAFRVDTFSFQFSEQEPQQ